MLSVALALLIASVQTEAAFAEDATPATAESAKAAALGKLSRCGIRAEQLKVVRDEDTLEYWAVIVTPATEVAMPTYVCLARAEMEDGASVTFDDPDATQLFWRSHEEASREAARESLEKSGLLAKLPRYEPQKHSLADYAGLLDELCGFEPGKGLTVSGPAWLTVPYPLIVGDTPPPSCLLDAAAASNLHEHSITAGYADNQAPAPAD